MNISIDGTLLIQIAHALIGMYILQRWYINPVLATLVEEDRAYKQLEEEIVLQSQEQKMQKESCEQELMVVRKKLKAAIPQEIFSSSGTFSYTEEPVHLEISSKSDLTKIFAKMVESKVEEL